MAKKIGVLSFEAQLAEYLKIVLPPGSVQAYAGSAAPEDWLICDGRAISRTTYADLFAAIGTTHGQGDGSTTFNLPDYRGMFLRGRVDVSTVTGSGTVSSNNATFLSHGINRTGFKVRLSSGTLTGLATATDYFAIVVDTNTLAFATSLANAIAGTKIAISGANSAIIVQFEDPDVSSRTAATVGGNSGNQIGAIQNDNNKSHDHFVATSTGGGEIVTSDLSSTTRMARNGGGSSLYQGYQLKASTGTADVGLTSTTTGNESRPKNSLINYIIKT